MSLLERYTVTLSDQCTYEVAVAATDADHAEAVAQALLYAQDLADDVRIVARETSAKVLREPDQPAQIYDVRFDWVMRHVTKVRADDSVTAARMARPAVREAGPLEFPLEGDAVTITRVLLSTNESIPS